MDRQRWMAVLYVGVALLLVSQPITANAGKGIRTETQPYDGPSTALVLDFLYAGICNPGPTDHTQGCVRFDLTPKDKFISLKIEDESGRPVYGIAWDDTDLDFVEFCGETERPVPSPGGDFFYVQVIGTSSPTATPDGCFPSAPTLGTVTATLSRTRG